MQTETINIFSFDELSDSSKEKAVNNLRYSGGYLDWEWYEFIIADYKEMLEMLGFSNIDISFSGFCSQGDGASFTGDYSYRKGGLTELVSHAPNDAELIRLAKELQEIQRKHFYKITGKVYRISNHYCHENTVSFEIDYDCLPSLQSVVDVENEIKEIIRNISKEIYKALNDEYDYLMSDESDESVIDRIRSNEYQFNEQGGIV